MIHLGGSVSYHRADVQEALLEHISPSVQILTSHRLTSYRQTEDGVNLFFKNGKTATCDLLIGADGINSAVRKSFLAELKSLSDEEATRIARPVWTGTHVYRDLIDSETLRRDYPNHRALTLPMVVCVSALQLSFAPLTRSPAFQYCGKNQVTSSRSESRII